MTELSDLLPDNDGCGYRGDPDGHVLHHLHRIERMIMTEQADIDADTTLVQSLATSVIAIQAGVDALKAAAGGTADTTALDSALADLKSKVDATTADLPQPAPVPFPPAPTPATTGDVSTDGPPAEPAPSA